MKKITVSKKVTNLIEDLIGVTLSYGHHVVKVDEVYKTRDKLLKYIAKLEDIGGERYDPNGRGIMVMNYDGKYRKVK